MSLLTLDALTVIRGECPVVESASLTISPGEVVGLIGPNGAGKTTLMRAALGLLPHGGLSSLTQMPARNRAKHVAWLPQAREIAWPVAVETLVTLGRVPHLNAGQTPTAEDRAAVSHAIQTMDLTAFKDRAATQLSGGEQARVLIARALAQATPLILADEPVAGLDPGHQIATMEAFRALSRTGTSTLVSLHDLGLAARHCDRLILMDRGQIGADGPPETVLTQQHLRDTFGISAHLSRGEHGLIFQPLEVVRDD
ncbi:MAG: ABC transporter ATP-binding protein [Roseicyclus sp.]|nr:ABC transporter ATP-binding protein [Roseicyclus sp.]